MKKLTFLFAAILVLGACKKEPETPPVNTLDESKIITIDSLRNWQKSVSPGSVMITDSLQTFGVISMDESEGNIYKNLYVQDKGVGINVRLQVASDYKVGDSVRISLYGTELSEYSGVIQLNNVHPDSMIIRQSSGNAVAPEITTIPEITLEDEGKLVKLENVQFTNPELSKTYADAMNQSSQNRLLEDCNGNTIIVRTSGFADFADETVAQGNGSLIAIVSRFSTDIQLYIRDFDEIEMEGGRCSGQLLVKDFDDNSVTSGGWQTVQVTGMTVDWETSTAGGAPDPYGVISNYDGSNVEAENWLISPAMDVSNSAGASMQFQNAYNYNGPALQLLVSTDYTGAGDPNQATWTDLSSMASWSSGGWAWVNSGVIDLDAYIGGTLYIAFKYTGTNSSGSTWELDDIIVNG